MIREPFISHAWVGELLFEGDTAWLAIRVLQDLGAAPRFFGCGLHETDAAGKGFRES